MRAPRRRGNALRKLAVVLAIASAFGLYSESTPFAFNYVIDANGTYWGIQDADSPRVDTGSIRATQIAPGGTDRSVQHARSTASAASRSSSRRHRRRTSTAS